LRESFTCFSPRRRNFFFIYLVPSKSIFLRLYFFLCSTFTFLRFVSPEVAPLPWPLWIGAALAHRCVRQRQRRSTTTVIDPRACLRVTSFGFYTTSRIVHTPPPQSSTPIFRTRIAGATPFPTLHANTHTYTTLSPPPPVVYGVRPKSVAPRIPDSGTTVTCDRPMYSTNTLQRPIPLV